MNRLPSGTVAFVMTDVEASTRLWQEHGEDMEEALGRLDEEIHRCVEARGGRVVKSRGEGDSHFAVFDRASAALLAAVELQRARAMVDGPKVRVAVHAGEAAPRRGDYLGTAVNRTARLRSVAHGGQIVVSRVVADLVEGLAGVTLRSWAAIGSVTSTSRSKFSRPAPRASRRTSRRSSPLTLRPRSS